MTIQPRFIEYFRTTFFQDKEEELQEFLKALEKAIPRTLRIKPGKETEVKERLESYGFLLVPTNIQNVWSIDRKDDFDPLERRIGFTLDHLIGNFYIQELAAATSVEVLSEGQIHRDPFLILDMAASPGGKTTQLAEQYPESFIIANEPTRERIPQLLQNLDRMGSTNIAVTLYPGQYFRKSEEIFDRILLDAPCSGEGTLYKGTDAVKHWHIKNIKNIANLQSRLFLAGLSALKVGGEMVYSTCSLNKLENEEVLSLISKYPNCFEVLYEKRFWPHIDHTGGFFVAKIRKLRSLPEKDGGKIISEKNSQLKPYRGSFPYRLKDGYRLFNHEQKILGVKDHPRLHEIQELYYYMRFGELIGHVDGGFVPSGHIERYIDTNEMEIYEIEDEIVLDHYLRGGALEDGGPDTHDLCISYRGSMIMKESRKNGIISNNFPRDWLRK